MQIIDAEFIWSMSFNTRAISFEAECAIEHMPNQKYFVEVKRSRKKK